jgi:hypothetical protein
MTPGRHLRVKAVDEGGAIRERLPIGKGFFRVMHGWSGLPCVRPLDASLLMAAGHNALREIRSRSQKHAKSCREGVPMPGSTGWMPLSFHWPFQPRERTLGPRISESGPLSNFSGSEVL